jgi:dihydrofolate reductase
MSTDMSGTSHRKIVLYIATSFDGYIARDNGDIDWLSMVESQNEDYGYKDFLKSVDTVIMEQRTYDQVLTLGDFPYKDKKCYVISRTTRPKDDYVEFFSGDMSELISEIRQKDGLNIWLVGGAQIVKEFLSKNLIDMYIISILPILLGKGIMLFRSDMPEIRLKLCRNIAYPSGLVQLSYERSN